MSLLEQIKEKQLTARKAQDDIAKSLLTTLVAEATVPGKNNGNRESTDEEVIAVIKKFIKGVNETLDALKFSSDGRVLVAHKEKEILEQFLPAQLTEEQLREIIGGIIVGLGEKNPKLMGKVLSLVKEKYNGQYDGSIAAKLTKELLI
jgi:uncharacterized protein